MKFSEFIKLVMKRHGNGIYKHMRVGQIFFKTLHDLEPETAAKICGHTHLDPFLTDENLNNFLEWLVQEWRA